MAVTEVCGLSDEALTPGASGPEVVKEVNGKLQTIFGNDHGFMDRVACVESNNGLDPNTYRNGYHGGIFQVDRIGFEDTKDTASHPGLIKKYERIEMETGINWPTVEYEDLRKPIHSAIGARLLVSNNPEPIPANVEDQADYWKKNYNTAEGKGDPSKFPKNKRQTNSEEVDERDVNDFINCPTYVCSKFLSFDLINILCKLIQIT